MEVKKELAEVPISSWHKFRLNGVDVVMPSTKRHQPQQVSREMKELKERNKLIRKARKNGFTYRLIGLWYGNLSRQRVFQIVSKKPQVGRWRLLWNTLIRRH